MTKPTTPQPSPLAEQWDIGIATMTDGTKLVVVSVIGPAGTKVSFLAPEAAAHIGEQIKVTAAQARTGLVLPTGVQMPPNGHGSPR
jgi:hypothetical protein